MGISDSVRQVFAQFRSDPFAWEGFRALSGVLFFVAFVSVSIEYAAARHWSLGVLLTAASGALVVWLAIRAASFGRHHPISLVLLSLFVAVLLGSVVCAGISYILHLQGWAGYNAPQHATMDTFRNFYLWTFLDMVPAVDVWKNFPVKSPVEPTDAIAGIPILVFRIFILGFVFASIRRWWELHAVGDAGATQPAVDQSQMSMMPRTSTNP